MSATTDNTELKELNDIAKEKQNKLTAGEGITIENDTISSTGGGISSITTVGDNILTLSTSTDKNEVTITGSVDMFTKEEITNMISTAIGGGITGAEAISTSPLSLSTSVANGLLTITGSVDMSGYAKKTDVIESVQTVVDSPLSLDGYIDGSTLHLEASVDLGNYVTMIDFTDEFSSLTQKLEEEINDKQNNLKYYYEGNETAEIALDADTTALEVAKDSLSMWSGTGSSSIKLHDDGFDCTMTGNLFIGGNTPADHPTINVYYNNLSLYGVANSGRAKFYIQNGEIETQSVDYISILNTATLTVHDVNNIELTDIGLFSYNGYEVATVNDLKSYATTSDLSSKQNKLIYYSENTSSSSAHLSADDVDISSEGHNISIDSSVDVDLHANEDINLSAEDMVQIDASDFHITANTALYNDNEIATVKDLETKQDKLEDYHFVVENKTLFVPYIMSTKITLYKGTEKVSITRSDIQDIEEGAVGDEKEVISQSLTNNSDGTITFSVSLSSSTQRFDDFYFEYYLDFDNGDYSESIFIQVLHSESVYNMYPKIPTSISATYSGSVDSGTITITTVPESACKGVFYYCTDYPQNYVFDGQGGYKYYSSNTGASATVPMSATIKITSVLDPTVYCTLLLDYATVAPDPN